MSPSLLNRFVALVVATALPLLAAALLLGAWARPAAAGGGTFNYPGVGVCSASLQACIDGHTAGDTINILPGTYNESVTLNQAISLVGGGAANTTLQAVSSQRVLTVTGAGITSSVVISGLTLAEGLITGTASCPASCGGGVAVLNGAAPALMNLILRDNTAGYRGGGLYAASSLSLTNVSFTDNTSVNHGGGGYIGAAARVVGGRYEGNVCSFANCFGGGLIVTSTLILQGVEFVANRSGSGGAGVYNFGPTTVSASWFERNVCTGDSVFGQCYGAGLEAGRDLLGNLPPLPHPMVLTNTVFLSNTATHRGGGAELHGLTWVTGGRFEGNTAYESGGLSVRGSLTVSGTHFLSNTATNFNGGGAQVGDSVVRHNSFAGAVFQGNSSGGSGGGGGLYAGGVLTLVNTTFSANTAVGSGGGVNGRNVTLIGGGFDDNTCTGPACQGGGLYVGSGGLTATLPVFAANQATNDGGGAYVESGVTTLTNGVFENNRCLGAGCDGGALYAGGNVFITQTAFLSNTTSKLGGALFAEASVGLTRSRFENNICLLSTCDGGALALTGGGAGQAVRIVNVLFARNLAADTGNAVYSNFSGGRQEIVHTTITSPTLAAGTALIFWGSPVFITNTLITSHTVGLSSYSALTETHSLFFGNGLNFTGTVTSAGGSLTGNPHFVNPAAGDYHLTALSAAVNQGVAAGVPDDYDGQARPQMGAPDIGYDESPYAVGGEYSMWLPEIWR